MAHISLSLDALYQLAVHFTKFYQEANTDRLSCIVLYDDLVTRFQQSSYYSEEQKRIILNGALDFILADIKGREYDGVSPQKKDNWIIPHWMWAPTGSDLYMEVKKCRNINKTNPLGYDERIFQLHEFYKCVSTYTHEDMQRLRQHPKLKGHRVKLKWHTSQILLENIYSALEFAKQRNSAILESLIHGVPVSSTIFNNFTHIDEEYYAKKTTSINPKRPETTNFMEFIRLSCLDDPDSESSWKISLGTAYVILMRIHPEYLLRSAKKNSEQFQFGLRTLNQEDINLITVEDKIVWLKSLSAHLTILMNNQKYYVNLLNQVLENTKDQKIGNKTQELSKEILNQQIQSIRQEIENELSKCQIEKKSPSRTETLVSKGTSYSVQCAVGPLAMQVAKNVAVDSLGLGALIPTSMFGSLFVSVAGVMVMTGLDKMLLQGAISAASAKLFAYVLGKIGDTVGNATANIFVHSFFATSQGLEDLRKKLKYQDDIVFVNMVNVFLDEELQLVTEDEQGHIRNVLGLKQGEKLKPVTMAEKRDDVSEELSSDDSFREEEWVRIGP